MVSLPPYKPAKELPKRELHFAQMVLPQNPKPVPPELRLRVDVTRVEIPGVLDAELPLTRAGLTIPGTRESAPVLSVGPGGLDIPWAHHPNVPALLIPGTSVEEIRWQNRWMVSHFVSPSLVGLPFTAEGLARAAWHAISRIGPLELAITEVAQLASRVDAMGYADQRGCGLLEQLQLPESIHMRVKAEMGPKRPLFDARCLRWVLTEMCVALKARPRPSKLSDPESDQIIGQFLPLLGRSGIPFRREMYRALWFLHQGFSLGGGPEADPTDQLAMLAMTSANTVGIRLFDDPDEHVLRAGEMWATEDDDPFIAGRDVCPSDIRRMFEATTGVTTVTFTLLSLFESWAIRASHLTRPGAQEAARRAQGATATKGGYDDFVNFLRWKISSTPKEFGAAVLAEMERYDRGYTGWGSVPQHASETLRDRPLLQIGKHMVVLGHGLFLTRASELPAVVFADRHGLSRQEMRGKTGHLFEARIQRRLVELRARRCWTATEDEIDAVVPTGSRRPDAIIGSVSLRYLLVEIGSSRLETGVAAGNLGSVDNLIDRYIKKRRQAETWIEEAPELIGRLHGVGRAPVASAMPLLVIDEPLPNNPALERAIQSKLPGSNPRFVCSIAEFEKLLDLADAGWDAPQLVESWQQHGHGQMLGTFLRSHTTAPHKGETTVSRFAKLFDGRAA